MAQQKHQRSDSRRNRESVIDTAMTVIAAEPNASMATIAERSGLGRTTVYRHFATREELLRAIFERAVSEANAATSSVIAEGLTTRESLLRLGPAIIAIPRRFNFLAGARSIGGDVILQGTLDPSQPMRHFIKAAQARGDIDPSIPTQLILSLINGLATGFATELHAARIEATRAGELFGAMMVKLLIDDDRPEA